MRQVNDMEATAEFKEYALSKFSGSETDTEAAGSPRAPSIWCFGVEHGAHKGWEDESPGIRERESQYCGSHSIERQMKWPYNRGLFKLLAAIHGRAVEDYREFAYERQPFARNRPGFFKGNLYPYSFRRAADYTEQARREIGMPTRDAYYAWCDKYRIPEIHKWFEEHRPRVFIGIGTLCKDEFAAAVFGEAAELSRKVIAVNGREKNLFSRVDGWRKLVVVPHFSGKYGLNNNQSIQEAGEYIASIMGIGQSDFSEQRTSGSLAEFLDEFDLGEGGYAIAPAREAKTAVRRLLREKRGRR